jgi:antitoxin component YwqK of YwqJK toxin-antitoxin module
MKKTFYTFLIAVLIIASIIAGWIFAYFFVDFGKEKVKDKPWSYIFPQTTIEFPVPDSDYVVPESYKNKKSTKLLTEDVINVKGTYTGEIKDNKPEGRGEFKGLLNGKEGKRLVVFKGEFKGGKAVNGLETIYYSNGQLRSNTEIKDGKFNGKSRGYYPDGKLKIESESKDGKPHGDYKHYFPNGQLEIAAKLKDGKLNGLFKIYYYNGQLRREMELKDDKPNGMVKKYYEDGKLWQEEEYKNGELLQVKRY